jgi:hypothetical protein
MGAIGAYSTCSSSCGLLDDYRSLLLATNLFDFRFGFDDF